jgi:hypothetical protein
MDQESPNFKPNGTSSRKSHAGFVDAFIVDVPDLAQSTRFQNLLNFFIQCIYSITGNSSDRDSSIEHFYTCIDHLKGIHFSGVYIFSQEIHSRLGDLIEEASHFESILRSFSLDNGIDNTVELLLAKKASSLQWLSVLILEDIRVLFSKPDSEKAKGH